MLACASSQRDSGRDLPNIIFILADDMGYDSVSAFNPQMGSLKTPHLDQLVQTGMSFTDAHSASAVCSPTRYGLLTGRYAWRTHLKRSVLWPYAPPLIESDRLTVAELLKTQGYQTACIGKWHLGWMWPDKTGTMMNGDLKGYHKLSKTLRSKIQDCEQKINFSQALAGGPCDHGFDYYFGVDVPNFPPYTWIENRHCLAKQLMKKPRSMYGRAGQMAKGYAHDTVLPILTKKATRWIGQAAQKNKPFFLYFPLTSPHSPISPSDNFLGRSKISTYADFIMETDWVVGQVMAALEQSGQDHNTLLIFSADNGTAKYAEFEHLKSLGIDLQHHFRGYKSLIYEGGHRIPLIAKWPRHIKKALVNDQTVCLNDFMATVADIIGQPCPENSAEDSTSLLPLLMQTQNTLPDHPPLISHSMQGQFAIRDGEWKLIFPLEKEGQPELYNLKLDPKEASNVAEFHPQRVSNMTNQFKEIVTGTMNDGEQNAWEGLPWS